MADVSSPELKAAYDEVLLDSSETNWCLFKYEGKNKIVLAGKGSGGFAELAQELDQPEERLYAYLRVTSGDEESKRSKFAFISWCGDKVGPLAKANVSVHKASVKQVIKNIGVEFHYTTKEDIDEEELMTKIRKSSGADYSGNKSTN
ncbi:hypothetical protein RB653_003344 [Dictyostelium firmibasis]|uniref:Coactosin n=1 Tax=Dictyostelium firmibasis TaxID=79012 RepID=A0AAN7YWX8_9MYCE